MLQGYAGYDVSQEIIDANGNKVSEFITNNNCEIKSKPEKQKTHTNPVSKVTVRLPISTMTDFRYLGENAAKVSDLYAIAVKSGKPADFDFCFRFMFGVMMLTRCR